MLEQAAAQPNPVALTFVDLGDVNQHDDRNAAAEANFKRAIELAPEDPQARYLLGRLAQKMGNREEAHAELVKVQHLHQTKNSVPMQQMQPPNAVKQP